MVSPVVCPLPKVFNFPPLLLSYLIRYYPTSGLIDQGLKISFKLNIFPKHFPLLLLTYLIRYPPLHFCQCTRVGDLVSHGIFPPKHSLPPPTSTSVTYLIKYSPTSWLEYQDGRLSFTLKHFPPLFLTYLIKYSPTSWSVYQGGRLSFTRNISPIQASTVFWVVRFSDSA